ncbi:MAG: F0F1 ATP synthase subunit delta [Actinomycetota bacterium]|nr:F0F1 ATP synthase subunit delta [Actinomycetota bacterium]
MRAASAESLAAAQERLAAAASGGTRADLSGPPSGLFDAAKRALTSVVPGSSVDLPPMADGLFSVTRLLDRELGLRRTLADPAVDAGAKVRLVDDLLGAQLDPGALEALHGLVSSRWSRPVDLVDATETLAASALFLHAESEDVADDVEDELFRFSRILEREPGLQSALTDPGANHERRVQLVRSLLDGKAQPQTARVLEFLVADPRGRPLQVAIEQLAQLAAQRRAHLIAVVRSAVALSPQQQSRLAASLAGIYGRPVRLQMEVDPSVLGGMDVRVGDELVDGTVASRLAAARRTLTR